MPRVSEKGKEPMTEVSEVSQATEATEVSQVSEISQPPKCKVGRFWCMDHLPRSSIACLERVKNFYTDEIIRKYLHPMSTKKFHISCRLMEYACVNYAKKFKIAYRWEVEEEETDIYVSNEYERWLSQYNRRNFDFFRRYTRIYFEYEGKKYDTTVGQVFIIYWAISHGVMDYIEKNLSAIKKDMSHTHGQNRLDKQKYKLAGKKRKRQKLVEVPKGQCFIYKVPVRVSFNDDS